jgi:pentatricopeptide repeat protein
MMNHQRQVLFLRLWIQHHHSGKNAVWLSSSLLSQSSSSLRFYRSFRGTPDTTVVTASATLENGDPRWCWNPPTTTTYQQSFAGCCCGYSTSTTSMSMSTTAIATRSNETASRTQQQQQTSIVVSSFDDTWKEQTNKLLQDFPVGSFSDATWNQAQKTLQYWMEQEDLAMCWTIMDRLYQEAASGTTTATLAVTATNIARKSKPRLKTIEHLNTLLKLWMKELLRYCMNKKDRGGETHHPMRLPTHVAKLIQQYQQANLVHPDKATHSILLKAACQCQHFLPKHEGIEFVDTYFRTWIEEYVRWEDNENNNNNNNNCSNMKNHHQHRHDTPARPDIVALGTVTYAWSESNHPQAPHHAEQWVNDPLVQRLGLLSDNDVTIVYTNVMSAHAKIGNPFQAQVWKDRIVKETGASPDQTAYGTILNGWARYVKREVFNLKEEGQVDKLLQAAGHAENLLAEIEHSIPEGPTIVSYGTVMDIWSKLASIHSIARKAAARTYTILKVLQTRSVPGFDRTVYNIVLTAFARSRQPNMAKVLLDEMIVSSKASLRRGDVPVASPDVVSYSTVIMGYYLMSRMDSGDRGEAMLREMKRDGLIPNERVYNNCIKCWESSTSDRFAPDPLRQKAVQRAEALLQEMKTLYNIPPSCQIYHSLLSVYLQCQEFERAESLIKTWFLEYETTKSPRVRPDASLILRRVWAEASHPESLFHVASTAHNVLSLLVDEHDIQRNRDWYKRVLVAYSKVGPNNNNKATEKALELLNEMKNLAGIEPDVDCYKSVIQVLTSNNQEGSSSQVAQLFQEMKAMGFENEQSRQEYSRSTTRETDGRRMKHQRPKKVTGRKE